MKIIDLLQPNPHGYLVFDYFLLVIAVTTEVRALSKVKNQLQIEFPEMGSKLSSFSTLRPASPLLALMAKHLPHSELIQL